MTGPEERFAAILILPEEERGDVGVYSDSYLMLAKELRAQGIEVAYKHDSEHRLWRGRKGLGVVTPLELQVSLAVIPASFFFALQQLLDRRGSKDPVKIRVVHMTEGTSSSADMFEAEGSPAGVIEALRTFEEGRDNAG
jgi:hypothetical protein